MTFDHELTLVQQTSSTNAIGDSIRSETTVTVLCALKSVGRNEFYQASANGFKPEKVFVIHGYEYSGEQFVVFEGKRFKIIRTYETNFEEMEIVCTGLVNGGDDSGSFAENDEDDS